VLTADRMDTVNTVRRQSSQHGQYCPKPNAPAGGGWKKPGDNSRVFSTRSRIAQFVPRIGFRRTRTQSAPADGTRTRWLFELRPCQTLIEAIVVVADQYDCYTGSSTSTSTKQSSRSLLALPTLPFEHHRHIDSVPLPTECPAPQSAFPRLPTESSSHATSLYQPKAQRGPTLGG